MGKAFSGYDPDTGVGWFVVVDDETKSLYIVEYIPFPDGTVYMRDEHTLRFYELPRRMPLSKHLLTAKPEDLVRRLDTVSPELEETIRTFLKTNRETYQVSDG